MTARTLHVKCTAWEQVDAFLTRKLRKGKLLSMKVPFTAENGSPVTLGLELPTQVVVAIDGVIARSSPVEAGKPDAGKTWIEIELRGLTDEVLARIRSMASARGAKEPPSPPPAPALPPAAPARPSASLLGEELPADERELFQRLSTELRRLRAAPVHEVLGVAHDTTATDVRRGWKNLIRRHHPDLVARRAAPAITHLAEELTILTNRAYDRLRTALVAEGRAAVAGPALSTPPGWLVGFEDISSEPAAAAKERAPTKPPAATTPPAAVQGGEAFEQRARAMLGEGDAGTAREVLAAALVVYPRSRPLRSLYYVASALAALADGEVMLAQSQLETALAHHEQCVEAAQLLDHVRKHGGANAELTRRLFR